jgi:type IV secretory pathway VirB4 component
MRLPSLPDRRDHNSSQPASASGLAATVGPAALQVAPRHVQVGDHYTATFAVTGYPAEVGPAWLEPLLSYPARLDIALHIQPVPAPVAAASLRRQRARFESTRRLDADKGRLGDPTVEAAAGDAADLAARLARGAAKLFRTGIYLTVHARTPDELTEASAQVRAAAASVLLDIQPATWRHHHGWTTTLPLGADSLNMRRTLDTDALAAAFPLASHDLPAPLPGEPPAAGGVLYGVNTEGPGIVWWDRWRLDNHNSVVLARSGAGKSYLVKLEVLRNLYQDVHVAVIDPEDEYTTLAHHVGGTVVRLGQPGVRLNPLDLPTGDTRPDTLTRRGLFLHTLVTVMAGTTPAPEERAALDRAIITCYRGAGITTDPATWTQPAPLLRDLAAALEADQDPAAGTLAARLAPWVHGSFADLFAGPTTTAPGGHLVVWSLRHLSDELRTVGTLLALDAIWRDIDRPPPPPHRPATGHAGRHRPTAPDHNGRRGPSRPPQARRRLVVVDEAWLLMRDGEGARFLFRMAKAARKRHAGLTVVTQDAADLLGCELGVAVVANAATQILLRQSTQSIQAVQEAFGLTAGEARLLLSAQRGQALLVAGTTRVSFRVVASAGEDRLCQSLAGFDSPDPAAASDRLDGLFESEAG